MYSTGVECLLRQIPVQLKCPSLVNLYMCNRVSEKSRVCSSQLLQCQLSKLAAKNKVVKKLYERLNQFQESAIRTLSREAKE